MILTLILILIMGMFLGLIFALIGVAFLQMKQNEYSAFSNEYERYEKLITKTFKIIFIILGVLSVTLFSGLAYLGMR